MQVSLKESHAEHQVALTSLRGENAELRALVRKLQVSDSLEV